MDVKVFGPNLRDQSKGQFHVHRADCADCRHYGPGTKYGGDVEWVETLTDANVVEVVESIYDNGIIDERLADGEDRNDVIDEFSGDFWFAPCVGPDFPYHGPDNDYRATS